MYKKNPGRKFWYKHYIGVVYLWLCYLLFLEMGKLKSKLDKKTRRKVMGEFFNFTGQNMKLRIQAPKE